VTGKPTAEQITDFARSAGIELSPWQERLCRMVFAEPRTPLVLRGPYRRSLNPPADAKPPGGWPA
jgi:hypothetical protein